VKAEPSEHKETIRLVEILADEVGEPRNDGSPGSALYEVPFRLSQSPSEEWQKVFLETWDFPPQFTSMHRPGIARIEGSKIVLDGTTIEEVERYHLETLKIVVKRTNEIVANLASEQARSKDESTRVRGQHREHVREVAKRLKLD
jgi:hypothetical protein